MATSCVRAVAVAADVCANCGQEGGSDGVKLKNCTACLLVKYCGVDCQKAHRKIHKKSCKKRAAELKDERLYGQGLEISEGDFCPICLLAIPIPADKHSMLNPCCMKKVCNGCLFAGLKRGIYEKCPFCRTPMKINAADAEILALIQARVDKKDPEAIKHLGDQYMQGRHGLGQDAARAVELWTEAAELGSAYACYHVGVAFIGGSGVEQNVKKVFSSTKRQLCWVNQKPETISVTTSANVETTTVQ